MYKKITHTIVEEHFDHPVAGQIKKSVYRSEIPNDEIFSESKFRSDVHNYFTTYLTDLTGIIDSVTGTEDDLVVPFERLFQNGFVDTLGNMTKAIYPSYLGEKINEAMRRMALIGFVLSQQLRMGRDPQYMINTFSTAVSNNIAMALSGYNFSWPLNDIGTLFDNIGSTILAQMKAKMKKDSVAEKAAADKLASLFAIFEEVFVNGLIKQHPERFNRTATIVDEKIHSNDIM